MTLVVSHAGTSNADAFNVALRDALPAGLVFAGNLQHTAGLAPTSLVEAGGTIDAAWTAFPFGTTSTIRFDATVATSVTPGQVVTNTASTTHTSLPGSPGQLSTLNTFAYERTGNPSDPGGANTYAASDPATVTLFTNSLSGFVYADRNDDGIFQSGGGTPEPPIAAVTILLTGTDHLGNPVTLSTTTIADGSYVFANLRPGTYTLTQVQPAGYVDGRDIVGTLFGGTAGNDVITAIAIPTGGNASGTSYDFGERESADVSVVKSDAADPVVPGAALTYTLTVTNAGPSVATNVRVSDPMPSGTGFVSLSAPGWSCTAPAAGSAGDVACSIPSLAVGAVSTLTVQVTVAPTLVSGAVLTNAVAVRADTIDPQPDNNRDVETTHVATTDTADLAVTKVDLADPVQTGQTVTYTVVVTNRGPSGATGVVLTDPLPASLVLVSATPTQGAGCTGTTTLTCDLGAIASGGAASVSIVATSTAPGVVTNTASVTGTEPDANSEQQHGVGADDGGRPDGGRPGGAQDRHAGSGGARPGRHLHTDGRQPRAGRGGHGGGGRHAAGRHDLRVGRAAGRLDLPGAGGGRAVVHGALADVWRDGVDRRGRARGCQHAVGDDGEQHRHGDVGDARPGSDQQPGHRADVGAGTN